MKKCINCGKDIQNDNRFCPYCGAENLPQEKKLTIAEKKQLKEKERIELMQKSYIDPAVLDTLDEWDVDKIKVVDKGLVKSKIKTSILKFSLACVGIIAIIAGYLLMKFLWTENSFKFESTIKLLIILAGFIFAAFCLSKTIELGYYIKTLTLMNKTKFGIKKIGYGMPPLVVFNGKLFEIIIDGYCPQCEIEQKMHIEEVNGQFVVVCDVNRSHLYLLNTEKMAKKIFC